MRGLRLLVTNTDPGLATRGVLRPTVVLPRQLVNERTIEQLGTVISHERFIIVSTAGTR